MTPNLIQYIKNQFTHKYTPTNYIVATLESKLSGRIIVKNRAGPRILDQNN